MQPESRRQLLASCAELPVATTDIKHLLYAWSCLFSPDSEVYHFKPGIEVISWRRFSDSLIASAQKCGIPIGNIHSQMGSGYIPTRDFYRAVAIDAALNPLDSDLKQHSETNILIHAPYAASPKTQDTLVKARSGRTEIVWVENHPEPNGVEAAVQAVIDLKKLGINAHLMYDIWHAVCHQVDKSDPNWAPTSWKQMLSDLSWAYQLLDHLYPGTHIGIHFATGHEADMNGHHLIPIDHYTHEQLENFFVLCNQLNISTFVLEGSTHGLLRQLSSTARTSRYITEERRRNQQTFSQLMSAGLQKFLSS